MKDVLNYVKKGKTEYYYDPQNRLVCKISNYKRQNGKYLCDQITEYWYYYNDFGELIKTKCTRYCINKSNINTEDILREISYDDTLSDKFYYDDDIIYHNLLHDTIMDILNTDIFNNRERRIVCLYYGINCSRSYSLHELADMYGVTANRIMQIRNKALRKFRDRRKSRRKLIDFLED